MLTPFALSNANIWYLYLYHTHSSHQRSAGMAHMDCMILVRQWQQQLLFTITCYQCTPCWEWFSVLLKIFTEVEYSALCLVFLLSNHHCIISKRNRRIWISNSWLILNSNKAEQLLIAKGKYFEEKAKPVVHHLTVASVEVCQSSADSQTSAMHTAKPGCLCCFENSVLGCFTAVHWIYMTNVCLCFSICRAQ